MSTTPSEAYKSVGQWLIVFEKETGRIAHITEDISIAVQIEGSHLLGVVVDQKPEEITQENVAAWCYSEIGFTPFKVNQTQANSISLHEYNKQALEKLLIEKIDARRKTNIEVPTMGGAIKRLWASELELLESGGLPSLLVPLHLNKAASQNKPLAEFIEIEADEKNRKDVLLVLTEKAREKFLREIHVTCAAQLYTLRERIAGEISGIVPPSIKLHENSPYQQQEKDISSPLEKDRLRILLKQKINQIRLPYSSGFLGTEIAEKALLLAAHNFQATGVASHTQDLKTLVAYAATRYSDVVKATAQIIERHGQRMSMLFDTEQLKDLVHIKIELVTSQKQLADLAEHITQYQFTVKKNHPDLSSPKKQKKIYQQDISAEQIRYLITESRKQAGDARDIKHFESLTKEEFLIAAESGRPFFITKFVKDWPAFTLGLNWFKENFGYITVKARANDDIANAFSGQREHLSLNLREYLTLMDNQEMSATVLPPYLGNQVIPEISALCNWPDFFEDWAATKTWIGPAGTVTPLHCEYNDSLFAQISGSKSFFLYPPHASEALKLEEVNSVLFASQFDPQNPDFSEYPEMKSMPPIECVVKAGELLYLPAGWFHHVTEKTFSFSINRWSRDIPNGLKGNKAVSKPQSSALKMKEKK
jgi:DNA-binding MarR family transcriptional regulator